MPETYFSLNMSSPSSGLPSLFPSHIRHSTVLVNFVDFIFMFIETNAIAQCYFVSIFKSIFSSGCRESLFLKLVMGSESSDVGQIKARDLNPLLATRFYV